MHIHSLTVGPFAVNCYVVSPREEGPALVIDPGDEPGRIIDFLRSRRLEPVLLVNTHGHGDHIGANAALKEAFPGAVLAVHRDARPLLLDPERNLSQLFGFCTVSPPPDRLLEDGETLGVDGLAFEVIHLPGHSPGGICLGRGAADHTPPVLFTGDALFAGGIGRTDLPGMSGETLLASIRNRLLTLPDETVIYPGHGPASTIGGEKRTNPWL